MVKAIEFEADFLSTQKQVRPGMLCISHLWVYNRKTVCDTIYVVMLPFFKFYLADTRNKIYWIS